VQDIKQTSSRWIHESIGAKDFSWQQGYGAFTVSISNCEAVKEYIVKQPEHHRSKYFRKNTWRCYKSTKWCLTRSICGDEDLLFDFDFRRPSGTCLFATNTSHFVAG
jgi:hypothetical protein